MPRLPDAGIRAPDNLAKSLPEPIFCAAKPVVAAAFVAAAFVAGAFVVAARAFSILALAVADLDRADAAWADVVSNLAGAIAFCAWAYVVADAAVAAWAVAVADAADADAAWAVAERVRQFAGSHHDAVRADPHLYKRDTVVPHLRGPLSASTGQCGSQAHGG